MKVIAVSVEDDLHEWIENKAKDERLPMSTYIRTVFNKMMKEETR